MNDCCYGEKLIAAGTAIAFQLAQECRPEDLELLSDLFNVIGEQLALLANTKAGLTSFAVILAGQCFLSRVKAPMS